MVVHLARELKYTCQPFPDCSTCYYPKFEADTYVIVLSAQNRSAGSKSKGLRRKKKDEFAHFLILTWTAREENQILVLDFLSTEVVELAGLLL